MKRFISILLVIATLAGMCTNFAGCGSTVYVSRGEWIAALAERFGMDSTISETDYFSDVSVDSEYYLYIQSCADWGVVTNSESDKFNPEQDATVEFALETALLASEVDIGDQSVVDYAIANGMIKDAGFMSVRGRLTPEVATQIIDWTQNLYLNGVLEPREIVELKENVQQMPEDDTIVDNGDGTYNVSPETAQTLERGSVVIMPDDENESGVAVKVDEIVENEDGTVTVVTLEPEIEELLENLDVAAEISWTMQDVQLGEGVTPSGGVSGLVYDEETEGYYISTLGNWKGEPPQVTNLANGIIPDISVNVNFTKGSIKVNPEWDSLFGLGESFSVSGEYDEELPNEGKAKFEKTSVIPTTSSYGSSAYKTQLAINAYKGGEITLDELKSALNLNKNQEEKNPQTMENKFSGGYEITGSLKISDISAKIEAKYNVFSGLKASVTLDYTVTSSLSIKGKLSEELTVAKVKIPVGATGVTVDVKFQLFLDANGELTVKAVIDNTTKYSVDGGKVKKSSDESTSLSGIISCKIDFGPKVSVELCLFGQPLVDVGVKAAFRVKASASATYETKYTSEISNTDGIERLSINMKTYWKVSIDAYVPIITLEVNANKESVGYKLKLSASWTIIGEKKAKHIPLMEEEHVIWETSMLLDTMPEEETVPPTEVTKPTEDESVTYGDMLSIDTFFLSMDAGEQKSIAVTVLPEGYSMSDLMWTSSNTSVAQISNGVVTAVNEGVATITIRTTDGKYYVQCSISVNGQADEFIPLDENLGKV